MMPDFPLALWEVPPGSGVALVAPADFVANAVWRGRETKIAVREIKTSNGSDTFFRDVASSEVGNWLIRARSETYWRQILANLPDWESNVNRKFNLDCARYGHPGWHELTVGLRNAEWRVGNKCANFAAPQWELEDFLKCRATQIGHRVKSWLDDADSEARFALNWLHLSELEKQSRILQISKEDLQGIKALMRYILLSNEMHIATWSIMEQHKMMAVEDDYPSDSYIYWDEEDISSGENSPRRLQKWKLVLWRHFAPSVDEELLGWARCVNEEANELQAIRVTAAQPATAHEVLESHLALRDWWTNVGAPKEFARLMEQ